MTTARAPRRIVLFYKRLVTAGGAERLMMQEWLHLRRLGHEVRILTFALDRRALFGFDARIAADIHVCNGPGWLLRMARAWQFVRRFRCDAVILTSGAVELYFLSRLLPIPYLAHHHQPSSMANEGYEKYASVLAPHFDWLCRRTPESAMFRERRRNRGWREILSHEVRGRLYKAVLDRAHLVLVLSNYAKEEAERLFAAPAANLQGALDADAVARYREVTPLDVDANPVVLTVARLVPNKRIALAVRGFAELLRRRPNARHFIVGDGPERLQLQALIDELGLNDRCTLLGYVEEDELARWYKSCHVFVTVDWADFRLTSFEAWAALRPVVLANESEVNDDITTTGYAVMAAPTPDAIADAIEEALERAPRLDPKVLTAALDHYTWAAYVEAIAARLPGAERADSSTRSA